MIGKEGEKCASDQIDLSSESWSPCLDFYLKFQKKFSTENLDYAVVYKVCNGQHHGQAIAVYSRFPNLVLRGVIRIINRCSQILKKQISSSTAWNVLEK